MRSMKRFALAVAACACVALGGCTLGAALGAKAQVGDVDNGGYAVVDYPTDWYAAGVEKAGTQNVAVEPGVTYSSVLIAPEEPTQASGGEATVVCSCSANTTGANPLSSDERIVEPLKSQLGTLFGEDSIAEPVITRDGNVTTVTTTIDANGSSGGATISYKLIMVGDLCYIATGTVLDGTDETVTATIEDIVDSFGYVANSQV